MGELPEPSPTSGDSDLDAAIGWAARCPGASAGTLEVRPIWAM